MTHQSDSSRKLRIGALIALIVGAVLLRSSMFHVENPYLFLSSIYGYRLTTPWLGAVLAAVLPFLQLTLGLTLLFAPGSRPAAFGWSAALFLTFAVVQMIAYLRGMDVSCGCFSAGSDSPIGIASIGLAAVCAIAAICGRWFVVGGGETPCREESDKTRVGREPEPTCIPT